MVHQLIWGTKALLITVPFCLPSADLRNKSFIYYSSFFCWSQLIWGSKALLITVLFCWSISWSEKHKLYLLQFLFLQVHQLIWGTIALLIRVPFLLVHQLILGTKALLITVPFFAAPSADMKNKSFTYYSSFFCWSISWSEKQKLYLLQFLCAGPSADLRNIRFK